MSSSAHDSTDTVPAAQDANELRQRMADNLLAIGRHRDEAAFSDFYGYYAGRVKSFLMGKGMNDSIADELMQEIMLSVWRRADTYDPGRAAASTWLFTIARNRRIDYLRGNQRIEVELEDDMLELDESESGTQAELVDAQREAEQLHLALEALSPEQRQVMQLSCFRGLSHGDIAEWLQIPIGTVKSRIRLAMQSVRNSLKAPNQPKQSSGDEMAESGNSPDPSDECPP